MYVSSRNIIVLLLVVLHVFFLGCEKVEKKNKLDMIEHPTSKDEIIKIAQTALKKENIDSEKYTVIQVKEQTDEWIVEFTMPAPRPPGAEARVYISRINGNINVVRGE
jgi:hypothetical protein